MPAVTTLQPTQQTQQPAQQAGQTTQLPYTDNSGTLLNVVPKPKTVPTTQDLQQGSNTVMQAAQNTALNKANQPDQTMGQVQLGVQELLQKPMGKNYDAQKVNQNQLEQFDRNRAQAMAAFQQQNADIANTGVNREAAYNFAMQGAQGRSDLESKLSAETADRERAALLDALKLGMSTSQTQSGLDTDAFNRLIAARGAYEGEAGRELQKELTSADLTQRESQFARSLEQSGKQFADELAFKKYATDAGLTDAEAARVWQSSESAKTRTQQTSENALDRAQQLMMQGTDIQGQKDITALQGQIRSGQILQENDFAAAQSALDRAQQTALQSNDITAQQNIEKLRADLNAQAAEAQRKFESGESALSRTQQLLLQSNDIAGQKDITTLQGQIKAGELLSIQDFDKAQSALDRAQQTALQSGDIAGQKEITTLRASLDAAAQKADRDFQTATREATQIWQTGERVDTQNLERAQKAMDRQLELTMQGKDIAAQKIIEDNRSKLQLQMQTNDMGQQEKMAYLDAQLAEAKANNDVGRQEQIIGFQTMQDIKKIEQSQGFEAAQAELDRRFKTAVQSRDILAQKEMQKAQLTLQREQLEQDKVLADADRQLKAKGLDATILESQYNQIKDASGPDAAAAYLKDELGKQGITVQPPDPLATQKAIEADYNDAATQYALSHPADMTKNADGSISLSEKGKGDFLQWYNDNIYGNSTTDQYLTGEKPVETLIGKTGDPDYLAIKSKTSQWQPGANLSTGQYTRVGDTVVYIKEHTPGTSFTAVNLATGETYNSTTFNTMASNYWNSQPGVMKDNAAAAAAQKAKEAARINTNTNNALDIATGGIYGGLKSIFKW